MRKIAIITLILMVVFSTAVTAIGLMPGHQFYGEVTTNGEAAADGLLIVVEIDGDQVASTTTKDGKYGFDPVFIIPDDDQGRGGEDITFFVKDKSDDFQQGPVTFFQNAGHAEVDISVTGDFGSSSSSGGSGGSGGSSGGGSSGGSSGGGGGGFFLGTTSTAEDSGNETNETSENTQGDGNSEPCVADWSCGDWEDCIAGSQQRTCVDDNACDLDYVVTVESRTCELLSMEESVEEQLTPDTSIFSKITGAVIGGGEGNLGAVGLAAVVLVALFGAYFYFKKK